MKKNVGMTSQKKWRNEVGMSGMRSMSEWAACQNEKRVGVSSTLEWEDCRNITIPMSTAADSTYTVYCTCNYCCWFRDCYILTVFSFQRAAHSYPLLIPTCRSFWHAARSDMLLIPLIPTLFLHFFDLSSLHPFSFLNVSKKLVSPV